MQSKTLSVKHCTVKSNGFLASSTRSPMFQQTWWQCAPALFLASASASESFWTWWEQSVFPGVGGWLKCVGRNATADQSFFCRWSGAEMSDQPAEWVCMCVGAECLLAMLLTSLWSSTTLSNVSMVLRMPIAVTALSSPPSSSGPVWITWLNVMACQRENKDTVMIVSVDFKYSNILPCVRFFLSTLNAGNGLREQKVMLVLLKATGVIHVTSPCTELIAVSVANIWHRISMSTWQINSQTVKSFLKILMAKGRNTNASWNQIHVYAH